MIDGEILFAEIFPELWVLQDEDYDQALTLQIAIHTGTLSKCTMKKENR